MAACSSAVGDSLGIFLGSMGEPAADFGAGNAVAGDAASDNVATMSGIVKNPLLSFSKGLHATSSSAIVYPSALPTSSAGCAALSSEASSSTSPAGCAASFMLQNVCKQRSVSGLYGCGHRRFLSPLLGRHHLICRLCSVAKRSLKEQRLQ